MKKEVKYLKERKEEYVGCLGGRTRKGKMLELYFNLKNIKNYFKKYMLTTIGLETIKRHIETM